MKSGTFTISWLTGPCQSYEMCQLFWWSKTVPFFCGYNLWHEIRPLLVFLGSLGLFNQTKTQCLDWHKKLQLFFGKYLPFLLQGTSEINRQTCPLHREKSTSTSVWWVGNYESFLHQKIHSIFFFLLGRSLGHLCLAGNNQTNKLVHSSFYTTWLLARWGPLTRWGSWLLWHEVHFGWVQSFWPEMEILSILTTSDTMLGPRD
jgi:hypothetical protein